MKLFFPIISGQLCQQAIGVTDTVMAGAAGASELSGVALGASFFVPCMLAMTGMSLGIHPTVTRLLGAGRECEIPSRVRQAALVLLGFAFFLIALLLLLRPIYALIPSDPRMLEVARGYLAAVCFALPALAVCSLLRGFCESLSRTLPTLVFGLVCFALNVPLNWIFIYGKFGMPALGGIGCGVATALTLNIAALLFALWIARAKFCARYRFWQKSVSSGLQGCVSYLKLGAPLALSSAIEGAAFALSALIISPFGPEIVAAHSVAREPNVALIGERYGLDSAEGRGVMGVYISGTVFGTIFVGLMASFLAGLNLFHPYALAMAAGVGSASMMTAAVGSLSVIYPEMTDQLAAFGAASNMLSGLDGIYMSIWLALPLTEWLYKKCCILKYGHVLTKEEEAE